MFAENNYSKENLAALFYQILRKRSQQYEENQVNSQPKLRQAIINNTLKECKELMPNATNEQWNAAQKHLAQRLN